MNVPPDKITILGYCLGGQLATNLSKKVNCKSLLLVSPITNFGEINKAYVESKNLGKRFHSRLKKFIVNSKIFKLFTSNKLSLYDDLEKVNCPVYLFSSKKDPVTDVKWINKLEERLPDKENITYIKTFEDGHKFTDSKALFIARIISEHIFHSRLNYRI